MHYQIRIQVDASALKVLDENATNLVRELQRAGLDVRYPAPEEIDPPRELAIHRDPATIILATGAAAMMLGATIARILSAHDQTKEAKVKEIVSRPAMTPDGKPVRNRDGTAVIETVVTEWAPVIRGNSTQIKFLGLEVTFDDKHEPRATRSESK